MAFLKNFKKIKKFEKISVTKRVFLHIYYEGGKFVFLIILKKE